MSSTPGNALFRESSRASSIYLLEQGRVRLIRHTIDEHRVVLHMARIGELIAEAALCSVSLV